MLLSDLYKYIFKNETTAYIKLAEDGDQIQHYLNAQRVSSGEAASNQIMRLVYT